MGRKPKPIEQVLEEGQSRAIRAEQLAEIFGTDRRTICAEIERERRQGAPICASTRDQKGYYLAETGEQVRIYCRVLLHRVNEIQRTRRALLKTAQRMDRTAAGERRKGRPEAQPEAPETAEAVPISEAIAVSKR